MTDLGEFQPAAESNPSAAKQTPPPRRAKSRRGPKRHYFAVRASEGIIDLPRQPPLGYLTQARLVRGARAGDVNAKQILWLTHARLSYTVVNRYRVLPQDVPDAIQSSMIGLSRAIDRFEFERLNEFSTYAYFWLRQAIQRHRHRTSFLVPVPAHLYASYCAFRRHVVDAVSPDAWFDARAAMLDDNPERYHVLLRIHAIVEPSLLTPESLVSNGKHCPLEHVIRQDSNDTLRLAMAKLQDRERDVLIHRYGLFGANEATLEDVGRMFGVTRERIRQVQRIAEEKLAAVMTQLAPAFAASFVTEPSEADA